MNKAIEDLYRVMGEQCLPAPPIPPSLAPNIRMLGEQKWGTEPFDEREQYIHAPHVDALVAESAPKPKWLFGFGGHGANSYAYSLTCRLGPLTLAVQGHWVPWKLYNNPPRDAAVLAELFQVAGLLIQTAGDGHGPPRLLVNASPFRFEYSVRPIGPTAVGPPKQSKSDSEIHSLEQLSEVATQLLAREDPGEMNS